jgi:hypothetical protein
MHEVVFSSVVVYKSDIRFTSKWQGPNGGSKTLMLLMGRKEGKN